MVLYALALVSLCCADSIPEIGSGEATIIGRVCAVDWDDKGNVTAAVFSGTGEEYQIVNNAVGNQLIKLDGITVKAIGVVAENSKGNKSLTVTSYEVVSK